LPSRPLFANTAAKPQWSGSGTADSAQTIAEVPHNAAAPGPICLSLVEAGLGDVYCLTVPSTGNFELANGIVVANCGDEWRYACMSRPFMAVPENVVKKVDTGYKTYRSPIAEDWVSF